MLVKYKRKQINLKDYLRKQEFVLASHVEPLIINLIECAVKAGADKEKLMELISNE